jgi:hypothetical protein
VAFSSRKSHLSMHSKVYVYSKKCSNTTVVFAPEFFGPGLKARMIGAFFRRLTPSAPSGNAICNCSTNTTVVFAPECFVPGLKGA